MSLAHRYSEFSSAGSDVFEPDAKSTDANADEKLESFENGYQAGWQDAVEALEAEQRKISADFAQNLQDMTFTYQEARGKLLTSLKPVLEAIMLKLLPGTLSASLRAHLIEQIHDLLAESTENAIEFIVSPKNVAFLETLLKQQPAVPFLLKAEETLSEGQIFLKVDQAERYIDMDELGKNILNLLDSFFQQSVEVPNNG
ncbi:hypothetical protein [Roseobacter sp. GAI101]|uniref:hypothetical protein n=1 Tax=Roseobacter sp. (strain GAI101) TaxID=391589 RepID=UPI0001872353|nr:hypothetical protein [Roseobacter sp. GAI101]EEB85296.1 ABC transporter, ATP-binding [Roseobacter sp. GAI101]